MCLDWITKHPELADTVPDKLRADFTAKLNAGRSPRFLYRADLDNGQDWAGWQVKAKQGSTEKEKKPSGWSYYKLDAANSTSMVREDDDSRNRRRDWPAPGAATKAPWPWT